MAAKKRSRFCNAQQLAAIRSTGSLGRWRDILSLIIYPSPFAVEREIGFTLGAMHDRSSHRCAGNVRVAANRPSALLMLQAEGLTTPRTQPRLITTLRSCQVTVVGPSDQWRKQQYDYDDAKDL